MLVTFTCPAYADITMFGNEAVLLLKMMGHSGTVPSAILAEDIPAALLQLESSLEADRPSPHPSEEEDGGEPAVSLSLRAIPLVDVLKAAIKADCDVMWDSNKK